eukprot:CAMPEP_0172933488 /NCGR_PEP_ID=MMETSP1075-20121228/220532_1 /TAXON_ID=2916 /ORGANISM="Ceratium fusus, Strain PA161109" /LENGTH=226 /DNA_ID=CAMNT_0013794831 /DNA_START=627 /DNA_END=1309 /DNA_ORIENTATION=+
MACAVEALKAGAIQQLPQPYAAADATVVLVVGAALPPATQVPAAIQQGQLWRAQHALHAPLDLPAAQPTPPAATPTSSKLPQPYAAADATVVLVVGAALPPATQVPAAIQQGQLWRAQHALHAPLDLPAAQPTPPAARPPPPAASPTHPSPADALECGTLKGPNLMHAEAHKVSGGRLATVMELVEHLQAYGRPLHDGDVPGPALAKALFDRPMDFACRALLVSHM